MCHNFGSQQVFDSDQDPADRAAGNGLPMFSTVPSFPVSGLIGMVIPEVLDMLWWLAE